MDLAMLRDTFSPVLIHNRSIFSRDKKWIF